MCRESLESCYLHRLLLHALGSAREAAPAAASGADAAGVCLAALHLLSAVLGWSFSRGAWLGAGRLLRVVTHGCMLGWTHACVGGENGLPVMIMLPAPALTSLRDSQCLLPASAAGGSGVWRMLDSGRPAAEAASLRPPDSWREALLAPDSWGWLAQLAHAVW